MVMTMKNGITGGKRTVSEIRTSLVVNLPQILVDKEQAFKEQAPKS